MNEGVIQDRVATFSFSQKKDHHVHRKRRVMPIYENTALSVCDKN